MEKLQKYTFITMKRLQKYTFITMKRLQKYTFIEQHPVSWGHDKGHIWNDQSATMNKKIQKIHQTSVIGNMRLIMLRY
jgi:hypothetical protein